MLTVSTDQGRLGDDKNQQLLFFANVCFWNLVKFLPLPRPKLTPPTPMSLGTWLWSVKSCNHEILSWHIRAEFFLCQASVWIIITNVCLSYFNCPCRTKYSPLQDLSIFTPVARQKFLCLMISVRIIITNVSLSRVICITCVAHHKFETFYETISFHMCIVHAVECVNLSVNFLISHMSLKFGADPLCCFCDRQILYTKCGMKCFLSQLKVGSLNLHIWFPINFWFV